MMSSPAPDRPLGSLLKAFLHAAAQGPMVVAEVRGSTTEVYAVEILPIERTLGALDPSADTAALLLGELKRRFGAAAERAVRRELELTESRGLALSSRCVTSALETAQHVRAALDGVDYLTRLQVSAVFSGSGFLACCRELRLDPASLAPERRHTIDTRMDQQFQEAAQAGTAITPAEATRRLRRLLDETTP